LVVSRGGNRVGLGHELPSLPRGSARVTDTTSTGAAVPGTAHRRIRGSRPPARRTESRCVANSSAALLPFIASNCPLGLSNGRHHLTSRSSGATARAVTQADPPTASITAASSARPWTTRTCPARPSVATASARNSVRRLSDSTRSTRRSGRRTASTRPGRPAPDPTSTTRAPAGKRSLTTAQLIRCRSQIRAASRGPSKPRSIPTVVRTSAKHSASGRRSPKSWAAESGQSPCVLVAAGPADTRLSCRRG
jgi:hypothetical protein